jgi:O-antigen ligase
MDGLMVDSAHSLYLQNLLSVGLVGMVPLISLLFYLAYCCCRNLNPFVMFTLIVIVASSVTDTDTIGQTPTLMTLTLFLAAVWPGLEGMPPRQQLRVHAPGNHLSLRTS